MSFLDMTSLFILQPFIESETKCHYGGPQSCVQELHAGGKETLNYAKFKCVPLCQVMIELAPEKKTVKACGFWTKGHIEKWSRLLVPLCTVLFILAYIGAAANARDSNKQA